MLVKHIRAVITLMICLILTSCGSYSSSRNVDSTMSWSPRETGLGNDQRLISQYLDSKSKQGESFYLYYFTTELPPKPEDSSYQYKTILFCSGGPGQNLTMLSQNDRNGEEANFLDIPGYRIVYFHLRGSGFSQIPAFNEYDRYLRTRYAVEDIERIRKEVLGEKGTWAVVVGYSYGTVLAQQYAHYHPEKLNKLILVAPMSRHTFKQNKESSAKDTLLREMREKDVNTLETIYARRQFGVLAGLINDDPVNMTQTIVGEVNNELRDVEKVFGSLPVLIESYEKYKNLLAYSPKFFRALRKIRYVGWTPNADSKISDLQIQIGVLIADEVLRLRKGISIEERLKAKLGLSNEATEFCEQKLDSSEGSAHGFISSAKKLEAIKMKELKDLTTALCNARQEFSTGDSEGAKRLFYVIGFYDGLNIEYAEKLTSEAAKDDPKILTLGDGYLKKIGASPGEKPEPWDPAAFGHDKPTLILKGSADTVSAGGAAEHIYDNAVKNSGKILVEFPGIGHLMNIPDTLLRGTPDDQFGRWKGCEVKSHTIQDTRACLFDIFISEPFDQERFEILLQKIGQQLYCVTRAETDREEFVRGIRIKDGNRERWTMIGNCSGSS